MLVNKVSYRVEILFQDVQILKQDKWDNAVRNVLIWWMEWMFWWWIDGMMPYECEYIVNFVIQMNDVE